MKKVFKIIAMIFTLALMCAQVAVQASTNPVSSLAFTELANAPPGHTSIAIVNAVNSNQVVNQPIICQQIDRGVSVPYRGLIARDAITNNISSQDFKCNLYYTITPPEYQPCTLAGFRNEINKYPLAFDLGAWQRADKYI